VLRLAKNSLACSAQLMSQNGTHIESLPTSAANKNEDPLEDDDAELAMETESSSSVSKSKVESTSE
jgi:hypothetical protein